jgi:hypothetical protein
VAIGERDQATTHPLHQVQRLAVEDVMPYQEGDETFVSFAFVFPPGSHATGLDHRKRGAASQQAQQESIRRVQAKTISTEQPPYVSGYWRWHDAR